MFKNTDLYQNRHVKPIEVRSSLRFGSKFLFGQFVLDTKLETVFGLYGRFV